MPSTARDSAFDVESFIHEYYDAWSGSDLDRIMSYYAENVVLKIPGLRMEGTEAVREQFARPFTTAFPGNRHLIKNMIFGPDVVTVEFSFEAKHQGPFAGHAATGARISLPGCGVYEYDSAKRQITAGRVYFDVATLLQTITDLLESDRQKAAEALQFNKQNLSLITDLIPTLIHVLRTDGSVLYVNQAVLDYLGATLEEVQKEDYRARFFHPEDVERLREERRDALRRPTPFENEQRMLGKDGKYRWFLIRYNPLLDQQGKVERWYVAAFDIEDRKRAELERQQSQEALRNALDEIEKSESKLRQVIDAIPALAWCNLPDGPNEFLNKGWHEYTGLTPEQSQGWGWQAAFHPEDLPALMEKWMKMLGSGVPDEIEARLRRHDGVYRWFLIRAEPFRDEYGKIVRWYGTSTDIDDRKKAEEALQANERNLTVMINAIPALIHTGRPDGYLDYFNRRWLEYLGCSLVDVEGWKWTKWIHPDDLNGFVEKWKACLATGEVFEYESRVRRGDGQYRWMFHRKVPLRDEHRNIVRWYGSSFDIEDRKRAEVAEQALTRARSELAHMARVTTLSALTASIAHEINQPISAAVSSAGACLRWLNREQPEVQRAREAAMRIEEDGKRAAEIITHLKSIYKKDVSPQREMVSVNDVVGEMLMLLRSEADRHSVVMRTDLAVDLPSVSADRVLLQQVLMNLMRNGSEAMSEGGGDLKISTRRADGEVIVSVRDTGVGILTDQMEEIFNAFVTTKAGGMGMGLAISSTIIESHGGRLWVTANPRRGATFHFTLPIEPEAQT